MERAGASLALLIAMLLIVSISNSHRVVLDAEERASSSRSVRVQLVGEEAADSDVDRSRRLQPVSEEEADSEADFAAVPDTGKVQDAW